MSALGYLSPAWIHAIAWTLLHFLWQGALVGAAYGIGRLLLQNAAPRHRYALGLAALALLALLPILTLAQLAPGAYATSAGDAGVALFGARADATQPWLAALVALWAVGAGFCAVRVARQYLGLRTLVRDRAQSLEEWMPLLADVARRVGVSRPVRLLRSAVVQTPCVLGWLAPVIVLPAGVLAGLTRVEVELLLAHELCHLRRGDYLVNLVQLALEAVLFYHPVVHWISNEVRNEREACCDALVLELGADPIAYARTLARLEELRADEIAPALAASGGELLARIRRIVRGPTRHTIDPAGAGPALMPLVLTALLAVAPFAGATRPTAHDENAAVAHAVAKPVVVAPPPVALALPAPAAPPAPKAPLRVARVKTPSPAPTPVPRVAPPSPRPEPVAIPEIDFALVPARPQSHEVEVVDLAVAVDLDLPPIELPRRARESLSNCAFEVGTHMCNARTAAGAGAIDGGAGGWSREVSLAPPIGRESIGDSSKSVIFGRSVQPRNDSIRVSAPTGAQRANPNPPTQVR